MAGSRAVSDCEPGQVRKEAALSGPAHAPRTNLAGAGHRRARSKTRLDGGCTVRLTDGAACAPGSHTARRATAASPASSSVAAAPTPNHLSASRKLSVVLSPTVIVGSRALRGGGPTVMP
jgi:hypothetical protein